MKHYTLPKALYDVKGVRKILHHNNSCILYKRLEESLLNQERISRSHCIAYVVKGSVEIKAYGGDRVVSNENEMLFMPRDTYLISDLIKDKNGVEVFLVFFDHELVARFLSAKIGGYRNRETATPTVCKLNTNGNIESYLDSLKKIYFDMESDRDITDLKILEFLHLVYADNRNEIIDTLFASENQKKRRSIESIMVNNYDKNLTIADYANLSGRSLSTFNRDFKRKYGETPKQWLIKKKMEKAEQLLTQGTNVTDCAFEVGYSNVSHFIKAYKTIYGQTPKRVKKASFE